MSYRVRFLLLFAAACVAFPQRSPAPVVFRPSEKVKYRAPGEEEIIGNANELFAQAEAAEKDGQRSRAIKIYKRMVKKYPRSNLAPEATFRAGKLTEEQGDYLRAAPIYRGLMENYPQTRHFQEAIESQFRIGEILLNGKKRKILGVPVGSTLDEAVEIFAAIVRSAPYGRYTARAQFDIGRAREKEGSADLAIEAYQSVVEKFPNDPLAVDAQYQIGYIWFAATRSGTYDPDAADRARTAFQDFLFRFPKSEKAAQARENLALLDHRLTKGSLEIAKFYDKAKNYRAAVLYYNEVIRQQPGSPESAIAKTRIEQLRSKVGDAALQSAAEIAERRAKTNPKNTIAKSSTELPSNTQKPPAPPQMRGNPDEIAPLPPPTDPDSLPPPAAPDTSPAPDTSVAPEPSATPGATSTPAR
ncbi:MAG TPA: outer membrane protein assembly factor BamD [Chthoniobacterales bacterium]|jgi:outer membrane protein assembly factor BamD|nr:outer membrane protein assembly factor BamD [Chthoniobacterales bacterium]